MDSKITELSHNIPIVFSTDHNFIMPTGVAIHSLLITREKTEYDIYIIISDNVTEDDKNKLTAQVKSISTISTIQFLSIGDQFKECYEIRGVTVATYYRLLIPWLLPHIDKIIYSDGDIIFKAPLDELYHMDIGDNFILGNRKEKWQKKAETRIRSLGLDPAHYTNAGFLVINSKAQRDANLKEKFLYHSTKKYYFQDQDILNIVCKGHIIHFNSKYNCGPSAFKNLCCYGKLPYNDIVVIHYAGEKPWKAYCPFWTEWWKNYQASIFFNDKFYFSIMLQSLSLKKFFRDIIIKFKNKYLK